MIIIFDVDGTLVDGEAVDWRAYNEALGEITGVYPADSFYSAASEVTAQALAETFLEAHGLDPSTETLDRIRASYLRRLHLSTNANPASFTARPGAKDLLNYLGAHRDHQFAIATGCWKETSTHKLAASGLPIEGTPFASSSDHRRRSDIIALAAKRSGGSLEDAVYVGDGRWDFRACLELGIPFIGTGLKTDRLRAIGASHLLPEFSLAGFMDVINRLIRTH